jgi:hypothetical protein
MAVAESAREDRRMKGRKIKVRNTGTFTTDLDGNLNRRKQR